MYIIFLNVLIDELVVNDQHGSLEFSLFIFFHAIFQKQKYHKAYFFCMKSEIETSFIK